ncbi:LLM class flavin-dependent oxidoreductase [Pseudonocardia charpentierae]|uniref:LLM class flavin-dependent oxidoreductase n=1 Tax=Pseudonocardia charpentierae TaxID=3075545 RepID=A0ABU2NML3_9PSEU|nr:LLM class flavin-dependent oxidoreductase [Pseudonocardia sp. DSM 45834]MDT0353889.1 LLM class flavin-dependent oxidoreductase [Pseudonocardia sp. DSM 45834]
MPDRMRFGALLLSGQFPGQTHTQVLDATIAAAVAAENAGFDDVWIAEHHFMTYGVCPSAITLARHLLGATRRITVGTAASVLTTQHPIALAEQTLLLDQVSGGRFRLRVGRGGPWIDLDVSGTGYHRYDTGLPEALDLLLAVLSGAMVRGTGPLFRFPAVTVVPGPRTLPRPGVVAAATSTGTLHLAARRGLPLLLGMHADDAGKTTMLDHYADTAAERADPPHISAGLAFVADTDDEATAVIRSRLPDWLGLGLSGSHADGQPHRTRDPHEYTGVLCRIHPVGSPERCRRRLARSAARTGLSDLRCKC